jgi:hypothetical protein
MTTIQAKDQQASRTDTKGTRGTGQLGTADGGAFSNMFMASKNKLRAEVLRNERMALAARDSAEDSATCSRSKAPEPDDDDSAKAASANAQQAPQPEQSAPQEQGGQGSGVVTPFMLSSGVPQTSEESLDLTSLASLLPAGEDDGIFEVMMPGSGKIGVSVSDLPAGVSYLLMPEDDYMASRLRGHEMELEGYLKRRIRRNVKVAVL